jgi:hypothetical protein
VRVQHSGVLGDPAGPHQVDEPGHRLSLVHRVDDHAFQAPGRPDRVQRRLHRDAVVVPGPALEHGDLVVPQLPAQADELGGVPGDLLDLSPGLPDPGRRVDPDHPPRLFLAGEAGDHPGLGGAGDAAHDDGVEEDPQLPLLLLDLVSPVREAEAAEAVVRRAGRDRVRRAARGADVLQRLLPAALDADAEALVDQAHVRAHDPGQQDIAHPVVQRVGPVDPAFLHQPGFQAEPGRDRGDLAGVVGLHPADRDQRVRAPRQRVGDQVFQFPGLVPAEGEPGVAVLPLGPDGRAAQVGAQPF